MLTNGSNFIYMLPLLGSFITYVLGKLCPEGIF